MLRSIPFTYDLIRDWRMDLILSAAWFAAFGLLVNWLNADSCSGTFNWDGMANGGYCGEWKAAEALSFLSAICWLANAIIGMTMGYEVAVHEAVVGSVYWSFRCVDFCLYVFACCDDCWMCRGLSTSSGSLVPPVESLVQTES
jgi:Membrane-associating domain